MRPQEIGVVALIVLGVIVLLLPFLGMWVWGWWMMGHWMMGRTGMGLGIGLTTALVLAFAIGIILSGRSSTSQTEAGEILKRRLAAGEISLEQYENLRKAVQKSSSAAAK